MFHAQRRWVGGLVMPKFRRLNLLDEWTYGQSAHRQVCADKFFHEVLSNSGGDAFKLVFGRTVQILFHQILLFQKSETNLFDFQGSDSDPRGFWLIPKKIAGTFLSAWLPMPLSIFPPPL